MSNSVNGPEGPDDTSPAVSKEVAQTKMYRYRLDSVLQDLKEDSDRNRVNSDTRCVRSSRERALAITKIQEAIMWLGMDLKAMREEGFPGCDNPYPESYNPKSGVIEPTADNLKL